MKVLSSMGSVSSQKSKVLKYILFIKEQQFLKAKSI